MRLKVLIVDDSTFFAQMLKKSLEPFDAEVTGEATSKEELMNHLKMSKPDLVTMDMTIPGTDGIECIQLVKKFSPNSKILVISSMKDDEIVSKARKSGAAGYLQKPIDDDELALAMTRILSEKNMMVQLEKISERIFVECIMDVVNRLMHEAAVFQGEEELPKDTKRISAIIGLVGKYAGRMILSLPAACAEQIAALVLKKEVVSEDDIIQMVGEMANIIAGTASSMINRQDPVFGLRVSPPVIYFGENFAMSSVQVKSKKMLFKTNLGQIHIDYGFQEVEQPWM